VTYKDVYSDWKLDLFASLITTTNYNKSSTVTTAYITLKVHSIFTLRELVFHPTSRLQWPMTEVLASADFSSIFCDPIVFLEIYNLISRNLEI
jgi:hypothetical protein